MGETGKTEESLDESETLHLGPQSPSTRAAEESFLPQINLDDAINISNSNIKLLEGSSGMINKKKIMFHIKHVDSITNITATSGSKITRPYGTNNASNVVSNTALMKSP